MNVPKFVSVIAAALLLAACASDSGIGAVQPGEITGSPGGPQEVSAHLSDPEGSVLGAVKLTDEDSGVQVDVEVHGMTSGSHPLHLYGVGKCPPAGTTPAEEIGQLTPIQVTDAGVGSLSTLVGSVDLEELVTGDGTALVIDAEADTSSAPASDSEVSGDVGSDSACGAIGR